MFINIVAELQFSILPPLPPPYLPSDVSVQFLTTTSSLFHFCSGISFGAKMCMQPRSRVLRVNLGDAKIKDQTHEIE